MKNETTVEAGKYTGRTYQHKGITIRQFCDAINPSIHSHRDVATFLYTIGEGYTMLTRRTLADAKRAVEGGK